MRFIRPIFLLLLVVAVAPSYAGLFSKKTEPAPAVTNAPPPVVAPAPVATNTTPAVLAWDSDVKESRPVLGDANANVSFFLTNTSPVDAIVNSVTTSCGCTTAHLPPMPWTLKPGESGKIDASVNLAGKSGTLVKTLTVNSTAGTKMLQIRVVVPDASAARDGNIQMAMADRQAVFKDNCATCHVTPTVGKTGEPLYKAACGICHEAEHRATMVADLHNLKHPTDRDFWRVWIANGKPGSLMPAFAKSQGGPLTDEQINSLADYLSQAIPSDAATFH